MRYNEFLNLKPKKWKVSQIGHNTSSGLNFRFDICIDYIREKLVAKVGDNRRTNRCVDKLAL